MQEQARKLQIFTVISCSRLRQIETGSTIDLDSCRQCSYNKGVDVEKLVVLCSFPKKT